MQFRKNDDVSWVKYIPFLILASIIAPVMAPVMAPILIFGAVVWGVTQATKHSGTKWSGAPSRKPAGTPATPVRPLADNRPLKPVAPASAQPHSHAEKSSYDPESGGYFFFDVQPCTCPRCGFVTDTSHRFCSKCDTDLTKPHEPKKKTFKPKG